jgi:TetR/AcrR family transcriptional regulator of autoinduction and epiphytic fitness
MMQATPLTRAVDPRIERSRQVILRAALDELGEIGYGGFTIESVAARAGVGKSTIYRHWSDKLSLIADAFQTFHEEMGPDIESGSPREKLARIVRHVAEVVVSSTFSACIPALIDAAERDQDLRKFHLHFQREARRPLIKVIAEGVADGSFPPHVEPELAAFALLGAIFFCRLMTSKPLPPENAGKLIETMLGA